MSDLFDDIAKNHVPAEPEFEDLPPKVWCLGTTATDENGGWAPGVGKVGDPEKNYWQFKVGLRCVGGEEGKIEKKHENKFCGYSTFVLPSEEYDKPEAIISGRFAGFLNVVFSVGIGDEEDLKTKEGKEARRQARWNNTIEALRKVSKDKGLSLSDYEAVTENPEHNKAIFIAGLAVAALEGEARTLLFKTKLGKPFERDGAEVQNVECGAVEDATEGQRVKRKIMNLETGEAAGSTF